MRSRQIAWLCLLCLLLTGCWDRIEIEDQIYVVSLGLDKGETEHYRVTARMAVFASHETGILGGRAGGAPPSELLVVEADSVAQAVYVMNSSVSRRISMRHVRAILVGEALAREGLRDLLAELTRNPEIRATTSFHVARGSAFDVLRLAHWVGEFNPARVPEGILLVEKQLHMAPPTRLHHMINRTGARGIQPFASALAINRGVTGEAGPSGAEDSARAGEMNRVAGNPVEIAGTAIFRETALAGFLTVDETQALLALRGEMGKAYVTIPDPFRPEQTLMVRFQQENLPKYRATLTPAGPRVHVRLIFEGEVLTGMEDYRLVSVRHQVEDAARRHLDDQMRRVIAKLCEWRTDPVGFGLLFRNQFATWSDWDRYHWADQLGKLQVEVVSDMRVRRYGLTLGTAEQMKE